jgi:hypothetical protein
MWSNGQSFAAGGTAGEPWLIRVLGPMPPH